MRRSLVKNIVIGAGVVLAVALLVGVGLRAYTNNPRTDTPIVYSQNAMLLDLWNAYKTENIEQGTNRTLDKQQDNISTSEGQSYTMMRAVWTDDRDTFDKSWQWTKDNLQRDDKLMSWKFGRLPDGSYGIQETVGGQNTASDGDSDIALALLMAYNRWNAPNYLYDAKPIIQAMWEKEVVFVNNKPILASNDLERNDQTKIIVNPSYLSPYAYKLFQKVDPTHNWNALADNSYDVINRSIDANLDKSSSAGLPPDWMQMNRATGELSKVDNANLTTNYSYDAFRTPWRLAMDWNWYQDQRAMSTLKKMSFLNKEWQQNNQIKTQYTHDGKVVGDYESPAAYGTAIAYFKVVDPDTASKIYDQKLKSLYDPNTQIWKETKSYYDDNWAWFGMALMEDALPNLAVER